MMMKDLEFHVPADRCLPPRRLGMGRRAWEWIADQLRPAFQEVLVHDPYCLILSCMPVDVTADGLGGMCVRDVHDINIMPVTAVQDMHTQVDILANLIMQQYRIDLVHDGNTMVMLTDATPRHDGTYPTTADDLMHSSVIMTGPTLHALAEHHPRPFAWRLPDMAVRRHERPTAAGPEMRIINTRVASDYADRLLAKYAARDDIGFVLQVVLKDADGWITNRILWVGESDLGAFDEQNLVLETLARVVMMVDVPPSDRTISRLLGDDAMFAFYHDRRFVPATFGQVGDRIMALHKAVSKGGAAT